MSVLTPSVLYVAAAPVLFFYFHLRRLPSHAYWNMKAAFLMFKWKVLIGMREKNRSRIRHVNIIWMFELLCCRKKIIQIYFVHLRHIPKRKQCISPATYFPNNTTFSPRSKVGLCACVYLNNNFDINKHTPFHSFLFAEGGQHISHHCLTRRAHILHHWHHHIICRGRGSSVEGCGDGKKSWLHFWGCRKCY